MTEEEAHEFYKDPEHLRIAGPGRHPDGSLITDEDAERRQIARRRPPGWADEGQQITDAINADPAEVERLRESRQQGRDGLVLPRDEWEVVRQVQDALAAVERGEVVDLGDFTQYAKPSAVTITYDAEAEAAYVYLVPQDEAHSARTQELSDSVNVDYDASGNVIGVELLGVQKPVIEPR